jgi:hypothetical protein
MNNRKQKINSFLNSITGKELDDYMKENNFRAKENQKKFEKIKNIRPETHQEIIFNGINKQAGDYISSVYNLGQAKVIAFVLECFYDNKYKISDLQYYLKAMIDGNEELKEYVYEIMKDF